MQIYNFFFKLYTQRESKRITIDVHSEWPVEQDLCEAVKIRDWVIRLVLGQLNQDLNIRNITSIFVDEYRKISPRVDPSHWYKVVKVIIKCSVDKLPQINGHVAYKIMNKTYKLTRVDCDGHVTSVIASPPSPKVKSKSQKTLSSQKVKGKNLKQPQHNIGIIITKSDPKDKDVDINIRETCNQTLTQTLTQIQQIDVSMNILCLMFNIIDTIKNIKNDAQPGIVKDLSKYYNAQSDIDRTAALKNLKPNKNGQTIDIIRNILNNNDIPHEAKNLYTIPDIPANIRATFNPPYNLNIVTGETVLAKLNSFFNDNLIGILDINKLPKYLIFDCRANLNIVLRFNIKEKIECNYLLIGIIANNDKSEYSYYKYDSYDKLSNTYKYYYSHDNRVISTSYYNNVISTTDTFVCLLYMKVGHKN